MGPVRLVVRACRVQEDVHAEADGSFSLNRSSGGAAVGIQAVWPPGHRSPQIVSQNQDFEATLLVDPQHVIMGEGASGRGIQNVEAPEQNVVPAHGRDGARGGNPPQEGADVSDECRVTAAIGSVEDDEAAQIDESSQVAFGRCVTQGGQSPLSGHVQEWSVEELGAGRRDRGWFGHRLEPGAKSDFDRELPQGPRMGFPVSRVT